MESRYLRALRADLRADLDPDGSPNQSWLVPPALCVPVWAKKGGRVKDPTKLLVADVVQAET